MALPFSIGNQPVKKNPLPYYTGLLPFIQRPSRYYYDSQIEKLKKAGIPAARQPQRGNPSVERDAWGYNKTNDHIWNVIYPDNAALQTANRVVNGFSAPPSPNKDMWILNSDLPGLQARSVPLGIAKRGNVFTLVSFKEPSLWHDTINNLEFQLKKKMHIDPNSLVDPNLKISSTAAKPAAKPAAKKTASKIKTPTSSAFPDYQLPAATAAMAAAPVSYSAGYGGGGGGQDVTVNAKPSPTTAPASGAGAAVSLGLLALMLIGRR